MSLALATKPHLVVAPVAGRLGAAVTGVDLCAIGDDTLQRKTQGTVVPESFTHGSAEQRKRWFTTGFKEGTIKACNTFAAARL